MAEGLRLVEDKLQEANIARKRGEAHRKLGQEDRAREAFEGGVKSLDDALAVLRGHPWYGFREATRENANQAALGELVEVFGTRGGLLQRLGAMQEALASYEAGAALEQRFQLASTYNRLNEVKCRIRVGTRLETLLPDIRQIADTIEQELSPGQGTADSGWAWSDLADCRALLGELDAAKKAYDTFIAQSETKSPDRALQVLRDLQASLEQAGDPGAARVERALQSLLARLQASGR